MPIFQKKVLEKQLKPLAIPVKQLKALEGWKNKIHSGELAKQSEVSLHAPFMQQIMVDVLGYTPFGQADTYTIAREYSIAKQKNSGSVDLALGEFVGDKLQDKIHAVFEIKGAKTKDLDAIMPGRHKSPVQQAWEYARDAKGCQWVLVTNYLEIRLYAVGETSLVYEKFELEKLTDPLEYAKFILCLHADNLLSGNTAQLLKQSHQADKDITDQLYQDYKSIRETLIGHLIADNSGLTPEELIGSAQKLLDRMLFIAFSEDRGLIPDDSIKQAYLHADPYNPRPIYENFKGLFNAIDKGNPHLNIPAYNGGLFAPDPFLDQLKVSDSLCEAFKNLAEYDFASEVSVTVLGHIFEQSIADLEELTERIQSGDTPKKIVKATSVSGKRKQDGVVYTPDNITAFIVEHTLGDYLRARFDLLLEDFGKLKPDGTIQWKRGTQTELKFWYAWQESLQQVKVVDPACGSGAFLVAAFDFLHAEYQRTNDKIAELTGQPGVFDLNKEILNNNLYGVDLNEESIEISKLSLWLKTAERGKPLTSLDNNLKAGNSLGLSEPVEGSSFCWQIAFADILESGGFDVVLGNPPYVRQELFSNIKPWLEKNYDVYHGVADLYAYFFELGLRLLKQDGMLGYISSATFFKTSSGLPLRKYLGHQAWLQKVVDFGDLQIFEGVTTYPAILIFKNQKPNENSPVEFLSLKEIPDDLNQAFNQSIGLMEAKQLQGDSWQLEDIRLSQLRFKLTHDQKGVPYPSLKNAYGSPLYGIKTGFNKAFVIDRATRDDIVSQDAKSAELIKPFLEGKDLKKWHAQPRDIYLIFTRRGVDIDLYPGIKSHLEKFKERLMPKPKNWSQSQKWAGRKPGSYEWFEIQDTVGYFEEFEKPKLMHAHFQSEPLFSMDSTSVYTNNKCYIHPNADFYLLGLMNSSTVWFFFKAITTMVRGGFFEATTQNIEKLPIPQASEEQRKIIGGRASFCQTLAEQRYAIELGFSRRLVEDLCPANIEPKLNQKCQAWWKLDFKTLQAELKKSFKLKANDTLIPVAERNDWQAYFEQEKAKHHALSQKIADSESQLNQAVYELFGLNEEEVALIELNI
ncbi:MAG: N-6 DNA methylase [Methyloprofundus sp.]|nr:N-6 DNA methylase [Methyloprofundus sp.]